VHLIIFIHTFVIVFSPIMGVAVGRLVGWVFGGWWVGIRWAVVGGWIVSRGIRRPLGGLFVGRWAVVWQGVALVGVVGVA
jgi:hypothetical protein